MKEAFDCKSCKTCEFDRFCSRPECIMRHDGSCAAYKKKTPISYEEKFFMLHGDSLARFLCDHGFCVDDRCPRLWDETSCFECIMEWLKAETIDY